MQKILEAFANDALRVEADVGKRSKEHQRVWEQGSKLQDVLEEKLGQKEKELFEERAVITPRNGLSTVIGLEY